MSGAGSRRAFLGGTLAGAAGLTGVTATSAAAQGVSTAADGLAGGRPRGRRVVTGVERLAASGWAELRGQRVGVITNPTGVMADLTHEVDVMAASDDVDLVAVFGPEHGFRGTAQAGESEDTYVDERTGVTVYDAYGATAETFAALFTEAGVETVVFDIQDVGCRFYTYIWTMYSAMVAAVSTGTRFVVLDRPNPVGGTAYGPMMTDAFTSGVGAEKIVQQHGMTVGELARFFDAELVPVDAGASLADLHVVQMQGWRADLAYVDTRLAWVPPSPNMPTPDTALVYPGTGMFEGVLASEGRGTTRPFELVGDPGYDWRWAEALSAYDLPGLVFREAYFAPTTSKHEGLTCGGVQVVVTDPTGVDAITAAVAMIVEAKRLFPAFAWRYDTYDPARPYWIDKLSGSPRLREMVDAGAGVDDVTGAWADELADFDRRRQPYLVYPGRG